MLDTILTQVRSCLEQLTDVRTGNNTTYAVADAALSALSVFFMQSPSFLAHQRDMQRNHGENNVRSLFGAYQIPSANQIRNLLDPVSPDEVGELFWQTYGELEQAGILDDHRGVRDTWLCGMDGTQYFSSYAIHCPQCSRRERDDKTLYSHTVMAPVLVAPDNDYVIALEPEFIQPQDGAEKQDCEQNAMKRWIEKHSHRFAPFSVTLLSDDLHSRQPTVAHCLAHKLNFIFVCLPDSHKTLYAEIELLERIDGIEQVVVRHWNGRFHELLTYRYTSDLPLRDGEDALLVNWCEVTITHEETGELLYRNSFITNFAVTEETVVEIVRSGRARWKTENEHHNTLKNHGYHLEHNFGHGEQHLSALLLALNLFAFLLHTVLRLTDTRYLEIRQELGTRRTFFNDLRALTRYLVFDSWDHLFRFMYTRLELDDQIPP